MIDDDHDICWICKGPVQDNCSAVLFSNTGRRSEWAHVDCWEAVEGLDDPELKGPGGCVK